MLSQPKVSVILVNWNGFTDTVECIESLLKIKYSNFDVIMVDNGSFNDEAKKLRERFNAIKIVELKRNLGFAIANNVGIQIALRKKPDYVLLLNNDTIVDTKFLKELVDVAESNPNAGILGSKMYFYDDKNKIWYAGGNLNMYFKHSQEGLFKTDDGKYDKTKNTDYVAGACMLIRTRIFEKVGLLPKEYFLGWEDIDFCFATRKKGYSCIFVPTSQIWHKASASFKRHNLDHKQVFYGFRNRFIMRNKYLSKPNFILFLVIQFCIIIPLHIGYYMIIYRDYKRIQSMFYGIMEGLKNKKRIRYEPD